MHAIFPLKVYTCYKILFKVAEFQSVYLTLYLISSYDKVSVFWNMTLCELMHFYPDFRRNCCLCVQYR